ncbi:MAG: PRTRC system protein B [Rhodoferax sp.]|nr:PRTRC system protein B [Rhodoferax sp.]
MKELAVNLQEDRYVLSSALLLYSRQRPEGYGKEAIATVHPVEEFAGKPIIRPGRPLVPYDYLTMVRALGFDEQPRMEWCDPSVLAKGMGKLIWWTPPMQRPMFLNVQNDAGIQCTSQGVCPLPAMVWMLNERHLYVYAVRGNERPIQTDQLCQAPLLNVASTGAVCLGSTVTPGEEARDDVLGWTSAFFESTFTHPGDVETGQLTKHVDPVEFWLSMVEKSPSAFPSEVLVDLDLFVGDLLTLEGGPDNVAVATGQEF